MAHFKTKSFYFHIKILINDHHILHYNSNQLPSIKKFTINMHDMNLICKGDKMIFQSGLISALFSAQGEILSSISNQSAAMQICSACTISLTDRLLLGMAFPKQLSFRCLIKQLAEKFDLITKITRKSIHHTTPLKNMFSSPMSFFDLSHVVYTSCVVQDVDAYTYFDQ